LIWLLGLCSDFFEWLARFSNGRPSWKLGADSKRFLVLQPELVVKFKKNLSRERGFLFGKKVDGNGEILIGAWCSDTLTSRYSWT
jgi:hypothetical protein